MTLTERLRHLINPLHIYCRMRDVYISKYTAKKLCQLYEKTLFTFLKRRIF